jgi:3-hydroxyisobutyrate dehydrogenase-like beta-hydroxyacid dehydrogenase
MTTSSAAKPPVAFLGLGKMGLAIATSLLRAGYPLVVWNRSAEKAAPLTAAGASLAESPAAAARAADIVISSLADDASLRAVVSGQDGVLAGLPPARSMSARAPTLRDSQTNSQACTRAASMSPVRWSAGSRPPRRRSW